MLALAFTLALLSAPPPMTVVDSAGATVDLRSAGRALPSVIVIMKGSWCPVCVAQLKSLESRLEAIESLEAKVMALNADSPKDNAALKQRVHLKIPIFADLKGHIIRGLGLWPMGHSTPLPGLVFMDACGEVVEVRSGRAPGRFADRYILRRLREIGQRGGRCKTFI